MRARRTTTALVGVLIMSGCVFGDDDGERVTADDPPAADEPTGPMPDAAALTDVLPGAEALPGPWEVLVADDPLDPDDEPTPLCEGAPGSILGDIVAQYDHGGTGAIYTRDETGQEGPEVGVVLSPLEDAADAVAGAADDLAACAAGGDEERTLARLDDPDLGDAALAWETRASVELAPGIEPLELRRSDWLVAVDDVVVSVTVGHAAPTPGSPPVEDLSDADAEAFVAAAVAAVDALR